MWISLPLKFTNPTNVEKSTDLSCIVMQHTSCQWNYIPMKQQNVDDPWTFAPAYKIYSTVSYHSNFIVISPWKKKTITSFWTNLHPIYTLSRIIRANLGWETSLEILGKLQEYYHNLKNNGQSNGMIQQASSDKKGSHELLVILLMYFLLQWGLNFQVSLCHLFFKNYIIYAIYNWLH